MHESVRSPRLSRRVMVVAASAAAAVLATASLAWACTIVQGSTRVSPTSGPRGTVITATGTGLVANAGYDLVFDDLPLNACHHGLYNLGSGTTNSTGTVSASGTIPATALPGNAEVCFAQQPSSATSSNPTTFTVT